MRKIFFLAFVAFSFALRAQKPVKFGDIPKEDLEMKIYPLDSSAEAVVLVDYGESTINYVQSQGFQLFFERVRRIKILNKEGLKWADFSIPLYHDGNQEEKITSLKVSTFNLENGKVVETKAKSDNFIRDKYDANTSITKVTWPNVKEGSILEIAYKVTSDFLFNFQDWEFQTTIPTRWSEYRARIPEYFNYEKYMQGYVPLIMNQSEVSPGSFTITSTEREVTRAGTSSSSFEQHQINYQENRSKWAAKDVRAFKVEPFMTASRDYISKINFELSFTNFTQEFRNPGVKRYMGSWEDIAKTYWDKVGGEITGNNSLKNTVQEITASITEQEQKLAVIFNFVRQTILWNDEYRRYPENSPKKTLDEKKGSSAEINFLLACMLEKAEIFVSPVLLSTRDHGFVRESIPVSSQFNHVVCLAKVGEKSFLLDATDKFLPLGMLPQRCINEKGLAVSKDGFQWVNLQPTLKTKTVIAADLALAESGELKGLLKIDNSGYNSVDARKSYVSKGEKEYVQTVAKGKPWTITKSEFQNVKESHLPFKETHEVTVNEHITEAGGTIYLSPFVLERMDQNPFKSDKRIYPIDFGHPYDEVYLVKILVPDGYTIDEMPKPKAIGLPGNIARYSYNSSQTGNTINVTSTLSINKGLFVPEEYPNLREFYNQIVAKQAEQIVLKKK